MKSSIVKRVLCTLAVGLLSVAVACTNQPSDLPETDSVTATGVPETLVPEGTDTPASDATPETSGIDPETDAATEPYTEIPTETTAETPTEAPAEDTASEASTEEQLEKPEREVYEDLSFNVPAYTNPDTKSASVQSEGTRDSGQIHLDFTALNGRYIISSTKVAANCHDVATCDTCGYVDTEDGGAYLMSSHGKDQGGITVTLATPILASSVTGMTLTFKTTAQAPSSSMRILTADQTNNAAFINACEPMSGATTQWATVNLGVKDFSELADNDGYIRSFQMYFRNKNKTDCYVQSVDFSVSPDEFLVVDEVAGNCFFAQGAAQAVADIIADRFAAADIRADISVNGAAYRKNSSEAAGSLRYTATATLSDGTVVTKQHTATIPAVTGVWLDATNGKYGSSHDSRGQWQETFDPSGLLFLTDNTLTCDEGVRSVEYAVVAGDLSYDDENVVWRTPHLLEMNKDGFSHLLVNAFLDLGSLLTEGESYRIMLRGVTNRDNYILHLDIPFVYAPLSTEACNALTAAQTALEQANFTCDADVENKEEHIRQQLSSLIDSENVAVDLEVLGEGLGSMCICVALRYGADITETRLPVYELNGQTITKVYDYVGQAFTKEAMIVKFSDEQTTITLTAPYDGDRHVILAADVIYDHAKAPLKVIESANYGYLKGEHCTPAPVTLAWTDANAAEGKSYTVCISESRDMSGALELDVVGTEVEVYNLNIGTTYYWQVKSGEEASPVQVFYTEDGYPRFVKLDGVSNVRDIGGYTTIDGRKVRQNLAYRSAQLDGISAEAKVIALEQLNIRTDLDLRGGGSTPLGGSVKHISVAMQWYEHIFEEDMYGVVRRTISTFADEENYPIIFHCSMGRDRTGTTTFLILGLLGVDEDTLRHEYYASFFSQQGAFDKTEFPLLIANVNRLVNELDNFGDKDDTLQEKIQAYLLHIGVTEEEIQSIRDIWLA
ncbi:MAG: tyrosine-protein phosphatase [Ruminococcaceae bacterium]|nr:tyrosine-protein phosphatase [Oscillospiraceae bacterium]